MRITGGRGKAAAALLVLAASGGCAMQPEYRAPQPEMPAAWSAAPAAAAPTLPAEAPAALSRWWRHFGSAELDALQQEALAHNADLRAAVQRIDQSRAALGASEAALLPTLGLGFSTARDYPAAGRATDRVLLEQAATHELTLDARYEIDLWGRNRSAADAALATAEASVFDRETVVMTLTADVALAYFQYLQALDRIAVAGANLDGMRGSLQRVSQRFEIGEGTELEVAQQRDLVAQAEAALPLYRLEAERSRNRLAVLVGRPPQALALSGGSLAVLAVPQVAPGLPSDLLLQRPDIRRAEAALRAADANVGLARARLLPSVALTGQVGYGAPGLATLLRPESLVWAVGAQLVASIFDGGRVAGEIAGSEARFGELAELYRRAVLSALRDTEDALAAVRFTGERAEAQARAEQRAQEALRLARASFDIGMADFLNVLDAERNLNRVRDDGVLARYARLEAAVALYRALGGGTLLPEGALAAPASPVALDGPVVLGAPRPRDGGEQRLRSQTGPAGTVHHLVVSDTYRATAFRQYDAATTGAGAVLPLRVAERRVGACAPVSWAGCDHVEVVEIGLDEALLRAAAADAAGLTIRIAARDGTGPTLHLPAEDARAQLEAVATPSRRP